MRPDDSAVEEEGDAFAEAQGDDDDNEASARAPPNLHPDDPANLATLSRFLQIVLANHLTDASVDQADCLVRECCADLLHVRLCAVIHFEGILKNASRMVRT